jgi:hypothetical protein
MDVNVQSLIDISWRHKMLVVFLLMLLLT